MTRANQLLLMLTMKSIQPNDYGKILTDQCAEVDINDLVREYRSEANYRVEKLLVQIGEVECQLTATNAGGGKRYWFLCPICSGRVGKLYQHPLNQLVGCRKCLNLDYRSRRYKGMVESQLPK